MILVTILSAAIILAFTTMEFFDYRRVSVDTSIVVDKSRGEKLTVNMNVTFPRVPCFREYQPQSHVQIRIINRPPVLSVDVMDISGETQRDISHNVLKTRLDSKGVMIPNSYSSELKNDLDTIHSAKGENYCGSCFGGLEPPSGCCNTCEEVRQAYINRGWAFGNPEAIEQCKDEGWADKLKEQASEGCNINGRLRINKVIGNIHLSPGRSFQSAARNIYELVPYLRDDGNRHDFTHTIHHLAFEGDDEYDFNKAEISSTMKQQLGVTNPLDGSYARVNLLPLASERVLKPFTDFKSTVHVPILPQSRLDAVPYIGRPNCTS